MVLPNRRGRAQETPPCRLPSYFARAIDVVARPPVPACRAMPSQRAAMPRPSLTCLMYVNMPRLPYRAYRDAALFRHRPRRIYRALRDREAACLPRGFSNDRGATEMPSSRAGRRRLPPATPSPQMPLVASSTVLPATEAWRATERSIFSSVSGGGVIARCFRHHGEMPTKVTERSRPPLREKECAASTAPYARLN